MLWAIARGCNPTLRDTAQQHQHHLAICYPTPVSATQTAALPADACLHKNPKHKSTSELQVKFFISQHTSNFCWIHLSPHQNCAGVPQSTRFMLDSCQHSNACPYRVHKNPQHPSTSKCSLNPQQIQHTLDSSQQTPISCWIHLSKHSYHAGNISVYTHIMLDSSQRTPIIYWIQLSTLMLKSLQQCRWQHAPA